MFKLNQTKPNTKAKSDYGVGGIGHPCKTLSALRCTKDRASSIMVSVSSGFDDAREDSALCWKKDRAAQMESLSSASVASMVSLLSGFSIPQWNLSGGSDDARGDSDFSPSIRCAIVIL